MNEEIKAHGGMFPNPPAERGGAKAEARVQHKNPSGLFQGWSL